MSKQQTPLERAVSWNVKYPVGTEVRFWSDDIKTGDGLKSRTLSSARIEGGKVTIYVAGNARPIPLSWVKPLNEKKEVDHA